MPPAPTAPPELQDLASSRHAGADSAYAGIFARQQRRIISVRAFLLFVGLAQLLWAWSSWGDATLSNASGEIVSGLTNLAIAFYLWRRDRALNILRGLAMRSKIYLESSSIRTPQQSEAAEELRLWLERAGNCADDRPKMTKRQNRRTHRNKPAPAERPRLALDNGQAWQTLSADH